MDAVEESLSRRCQCCAHAVRLVKACSKSCHTDGQFKTCLEFAWAIEPTILAGFAKFYEYYYGKREWTRSDIVQVALISHAAHRHCADVHLTASEMTIVCLALESMCLSEAEAVRWKDLMRWFDVPESRRSLLVRSVLSVAMNAPWVLSHCVE